MKLIIGIVLIIFFMGAMAVGCASDKRIDGKLYKTYGLINKDKVKDPCVNYEISITSAVLGALFFEILLLPPIYVYGLSLWEPIDKIPNCVE